MTDIDFEKRYCIHPAYMIKPDKTRAIITNAKGYETIPLPKDNVDTSITWLLHPVYAVMFSFFTGEKKLSAVVDDISEEMGMEKEQVIAMITPYINNSEHKVIRYMKEKMEEEALLPCNVFSIPIFFIVECNDNFRKDLYPKEAFYIKKELWDFDTFRLSSPTTITLMLTNKCVTNCIYCYANRDYKVEKPLATERILSLIEEADKMGVIEFDLAGGEILLHEDCDKILAHLTKHGFLVHLSTKMHLTEKDVCTLKAAGINKIQVSVDAWDADLLQQLLNVKSHYFDSLRQSLQLLEKHHIEVSIKSVITSINAAIEGVDLLLQNLIKYKNIRHISVAPGESSLYKDFQAYKTTAEVWDRVSEFVTAFGRQYTACEIRPQGYNAKSEVIDSVENKAAKFKTRGLCSGNVTSMYILPDGKVTICEELYWHPQFIIGDVTQQTIQEVWDSKEATDLYHLSQEKFPNYSACKHCKDFNLCRLRLGACWKMIFQAYGMDAWQLPDPRCPLAPPPVHEFYR